jgi:hypothetical protein
MSGIMTLLGVHCFSTLIVYLVIKLPLPMSAKVKKGCLVTAGFGSLA